MRRVVVAGTVLAMVSPLAPGGTVDEEIAARNQLNLRRSQIGLPALANHAQIEAAARGHANYLSLNRAFTHEQSPGLPGFTGVTMVDRLDAAGYPWMAAGEVMACSSDGGATHIEQLVAAIYHRFIMFSSSYSEQGAGYTAHPTCGSVLVTDLGARSAAPGTAPNGWVGLYPFDGQTGIPTRFNSDTESPDPVPGAIVVGYPVSIHLPSAGTVAVTSFSVAPAGGGALPVRLLTNAGDGFTPRFAASAIPLVTLAYGTTYNVGFSGTVNGVPLNRSWQFTTIPLLPLDVLVPARPALGDRVVAPIVGGSGAYTNLSYNYSQALTNPLSNVVFSSSNVAFTAADLGLVSMTVTDDEGRTGSHTFRVVGRRSDLNRDGKSDLVLHHNGTGLNSLWQMNGTSVAAFLNVTRLADTNWKLAATGDFNADGKSDLMWRHAVSGLNAVWLMNGAAILSSASLPALTDPSWQVVGSSDFDGDGKADLFFRNASTGLNSIWKMNGSTVASFLNVTRLADTNWKLAAVGDFNGDGKSDLMWRHAVSGQNAIWLMNGAALLSTASLPALTDPNWQVAGSGDFDADGKADLFFRNASTGLDSIWKMNGSTVASFLNVTRLADTNWKLAAVGDYNADGKSDLMWRHAVSGQNAIWLMNGAAILSSASLPAVTDVNWEVVGR